MNFMLPVEDEIQLFVRIPEECRSSAKNAFPLKLAPLCAQSEFLIWIQDVLSMYKCLMHLLCMSPRSLSTPYVWLRQHGTGIRSLSCQSGRWAFSTYLRRVFFPCQLTEFGLLFPRSPHPSSAFAFRSDGQPRVFWSLAQLFPWVFFCLLPSSEALYGRTFKFLLLNLVDLTLSVLYYIIYDIIAVTIRFCNIPKTSFCSLHVSQCVWTRNKSKSSEIITHEKDKGG